MSGEARPAVDRLPRRGEVWWVRIDKRRPAVVVQTDKLREPRIQTFLVVPLTSRTHMAELPGNVRLSRRATGLSKDSVANVYDVQKVLRSDLVEPVALLPSTDLVSVADGLRLVLDL
jgi:mRNA interferase MazF